LKSKSLIAKDRHRINPEHTMDSPLTWKIRYRQNPPVPCTLKPLPNNEVEVIFKEEQRAVAPGQIFVAYEGETCLGCGAIA
jgi:tRNA-specific 2-thiouridylase